MPYLAVDKDGTEQIFICRPEREMGKYWFGSNDDEIIELPKGSIKALIGYPLKWEDEPVELTEELLKRD